MSHRPRRKVADPATPARPRGRPRRNPVPLSQRLPPIPPLRPGAWDVSPELVTRMARMLLLDTGELVRLRDAVDRVWELELTLMRILSVHGPLSELTCWCHVCTLARLPLRKDMTQRGIPRNPKVQLPLPDPVYRTVVVRPAAQASRPLTGSHAPTGLRHTEGFFEDD